MAHGLVSTMERISRFRGMNIKSLRSFLILCAGLLLTVSLSITPTVASANSIIGVYDAPTNPVGATLTPDNRELWVPSYSGVSINVYDAITMSLVRTINSTALSGLSPIAVAFSPDGSIAYVTSEDHLIFINAVTGSFIPETGTSTPLVLDMDSGSSVQNFAVSENGRILYMPSSWLDKVFVYDVTNIQNIPTPIEISTVVNPTFISISSSKSLGVVSGSDGMQFFSLLTNQILPAQALLEINAYPSNPVFSPDGNFVYITWGLQGGGDELRKIDSYQRALVGSEVLPNDCSDACSGLSITPNGDQVWSSNANTSGFNIFSSESLLEISELNPPQPLYSQSSRIPAINSSGSKIYLLSVLAQKIVVASINPAQGIIPTPTPTQEELAQSGNSEDAIGISTLLLVVGIGLFALGILSRKKKHNL